MPRRRRLVGVVGLALCGLSIPALALPPMPQAGWVLQQLPGEPTDARGVLAEGRRLLDRYEFDRAAQLLHRGVEMLISSPTPVDDEQLGLAFVDLSVAYMRSGQTDRARESLKELGRLVPNYILDGNLYPQVFLREVEEARLSVERGPRATLALRGPDGATVRVDGRDIGTVPTEVVLPVGRHRVVVGETQRLVKLGERGGLLDLSSTPTTRQVEPPQPEAVASNELDWARDDGGGEGATSTRGTRQLPGLEPEVLENRAARLDAAITPSKAPWWVWAAIGTGVAVAAGSAVLAVQGSMNQVPASAPPPSTLPTR
ncbi:MAG TPA: PEGA domain-containing protein [Myxococcaceae bacterium]|nr:PEGA domain-containing protein [Myxococcaceae bacterium]